MALLWRHGRGELQWRHCTIPSTFAGERDHNNRNGTMSGNPQGLGDRLTLALSLVISSMTRLTESPTDRKLTTPRAWLIKRQKLYTWPNSPRSLTPGGGESNQSPWNCCPKQSRWAGGVAVYLFDVGTEIFEEAATLVAKKFQCHHYLYSASERLSEPVEPGQNSLKVDLKPQH